MNNSAFINSSDKLTADAFATSWNNLPSGSVYTKEQFEDWMHPITHKNIENKTVLELGCGNGSLMYHIVDWKPSFLEGVDLGESVLTCEHNMQLTNFENYKVTRFDLTEFVSDKFDFVYSIGVLHHLKDPYGGFKSVLKNTKDGGRFHCWVYAREGNALIIYLIDPIRKIASKLPWWITKYLIATTMVVPYFIYAKIIARFSFLKWLPLHEYSTWIAKRDFAFFRHVAFDQLVTPQTTYIERKTIEEWMNNTSEVDASSIYIIMRNGNSWKFGGVKKHPDKNN